ncbi:MAG: HAD-IB family hydrolase [Candidatus Omnitrophica bacterium]|nr:HAD-IB family hydrolase [Candidatus Omnitrophota bacterium]
MSRRAAFFDVDGTLVDCQTQKVLASVMTREKLLSPFQSVIATLWFFAYALGLTRTSENIRRRIYTVFTLRSKKEMDTLFSRVAEEIVRSHLRPGLIPIVRQHKKERISVFALSGSLSNLCLSICAEFGIERCFSTKLSVENDRYTGFWEGNILEGSNKVALMRQLADSEGIDLSECSAYADSYSDIPMLSVVGFPVAVSPDSRLKKHALRRKWRIIDDRIS